MPARRQSQGSRRRESHFFTSGLIEVRMLSVFFWGGDHYSGGHFEDVTIDPELFVAKGGGVSKPRPKLLLVSPRQVLEHALIFWFYSFLGLFFGGWQFVWFCPFLVGDWKKNEVSLLLPVTGAWQVVHCGNASIGGAGSLQAKFGVVAADPLVGLRM